MADISCSRFCAYDRFFRIETDAGTGGFLYADPVSDHGMSDNLYDSLCLCAAGQICKHGKKHIEKCCDTGVCKASVHGADIDCDCGAGVCNPLERSDADNRNADLAVSGGGCGGMAAVPSAAAYI